MPRLSSSIAPLAILAALATACGSNAAPTSEATSRSSDPIINGVASGPDDDAAVGLVLLDASGQMQAGCSGSLIAENLVLTARHCVSQVIDEGAVCSQTGQPLQGGRVGTDNPAKQLAVIYGTNPQLSPTGGVKADAYGAKIFHTTVNNLCNNDIALVLLDRKIAGAKLAQLRLDSPPVKGELMTAVGWGVANGVPVWNFARRRRADIPVVGVGPMSSANLGAIAPNEFEIGEGICSGDSGGPAFAQSTGAVIGVVSRGGNGYNNPDPQNNPAQSCVNFTGTDGTSYKAYNLYTRVDGFKDLIMQAFQEAGADPWLEGGPDPRKAKFADPCDGPDACQSALCIGVGTSSMCSQSCDPSTPCPDGYQCVNASGQGVCAPPNADSGTSSKGGCSIEPSHETSRTPLAFAMGLVGLVVAGVTRRRRG
jgi:MYXO-CTERM domain-containing protein